MNIVEFIFGSFWSFIGAVILIRVLFEGIAEVVKAVKGDRQ